MSEEVSRRPDDTPFKQQRLPAWQPILTCRTVVPTFLAVGVVFCIIGAVLLAASESVVESDPLVYHDKCTISSNATCTQVINVPTDMEPPVYMYYQLSNFYQNHRRYVKSRNDAQLAGEVVQDFDLLEDCRPLRSKNEESSTNPADFYFPCGLVPNSLFTDVFTNLRKKGSSSSITLKKEGIAWASDRTSGKFKDNAAAPGLNPPALGYRPKFTDEDFIVWMRTAGLPKFRKLYRIINEKVPKGEYEIDIKNLYKVSDFKGTKTIMLSTTSWMGGKNPFLGYAYIIVGGLCVLLGIAFALYNKSNNRPLGDPQYIVWNQQSNDPKNH
eukprot:TRINITY_DN2069_c0_g3_i2.p1 TRINITY_DN2069_c0_g3~~TRINITY_DN2069_c0_g3_i2.p1  ORF type:complete len:359 (+),score=80.11 TRINITY_DN2069_c0_g3_i2:99-1079(+)